MNHQARNFSATVLPEQQAGRQATAQRSTKLAPDCAGLNFFAIDYNVKSVMPHYIDDPLLAHILPYRQSRCAVWRQAAWLADASGAILRARQRDRFGRDDGERSYHRPIRKWRRLPVPLRHSRLSIAPACSTITTLPPILQCSSIWTEFGLILPGQYREQLIQ